MIRSDSSVSKVSFSRDCVGHEMRVIALNRMKVRCSRLHSVNGNTHWALFISVARELGDLMPLEVYVYICMCLVSNTVVSFICIPQVAATVLSLSSIHDFHRIDVICSFTDCVLH